MQPIGQLDDQNPHITTHRDDHLAHSFRLGRVTEFHLVELCHAVDQ